MIWLDLIWQLVKGLIIQSILLIPFALAVRYLSFTPFLFLVIVIGLGCLHVLTLSLWSAWNESRMKYSVSNVDEDEMTLSHGAYDFIYLLGNATIGIVLFVMITLYFGGLSLDTLTTDLGNICAYACQVK